MPEKSKKRSMLKLLGKNSTIWLRNRVSKYIALCHRGISVVVHRNSSLHCRLIIGIPSVYIVNRKKILADLWVILKKIWKTSKGNVTVSTKKLILWKNRSLDQLGEIILNFSYRRMHIKDAVQALYGKDDWTPRTIGSKLYDILKILFYLIKGRRTFWWTWFQLEKLEL